ncbi:hypothetical protein KPL70_023402 [Citrus sinensis]|nr:hypothetical protein KPL70_023402 [Citrus sinensis]
MASSSSSSYITSSKSSPISLSSTLFLPRSCKKHYQHAVIGTVLTTLHLGSLLLTFYPNFNMSLEDPNLPTTLKVQIQLQGAEQTSNSKIATLHNQIVYRLQNHALDLPTTQTTSDALMILANTDTIPTIIQIPKQIQKQELLKLMPLEWLTNCEQFHQNSEPVQTSQAIFERRPDGQVKLSFQTPEKLSPDPPRLSYTAMITAVSTGQESNIPIYGFSLEGYSVYPDKVNGHFLWDVPEAHMCNPDCPCLDDTDDDEDFKVLRRRRRRRKKKSSKTPCRLYPSGPPDDLESDQPLSIYRKALNQIEKESSSKPIPVQPQIKSCLMFSSSSQSYQESFPLLERHTDPQTKVVSQPYVQLPITTTGAGSAKLANPKCQCSESSSPPFW